MASAVNMTEMYVHYWMKSFSKVNAVIAPSEFLKDKLIEYGYNPQLIRKLYNFIDLEQYNVSNESDDYFLYFGRVSKEKGIMTLLKAMEEVKRSKLLIAGTGPMIEEAETFIKVNDIKNVKFLGYQQGDELRNTIKHAAFVTINSELYENNPMSMIEAMAMGKGVIGSCIGGIPELIEENANGLLYQPGNAHELAEKINTMLDNPALMKRSGKSARSFAEQHFDKETHYEQFMEIVRSI